MTSVKTPIIPTLPKIDQKLTPTKTVHQLDVLKKTAQYEINKCPKTGRIYIKLEGGRYSRLKNPKLCCVASPTPNCLGFNPSDNFTASLASKVAEALISKSPELAKFVLSHSSTLNMAASIRSPRTLETYGYWVQRYSQWTGNDPDQLISKAKTEDVNKKLYWFLVQLRNEGLKDGTILNAYKSIKCFYQANFIDGVKLLSILKNTLRRTPVYNDRPPTQEELSKMLDIADPREKTILTLMTLGGFRPSTLVKLQYRHVKRDLEAGIIPIHVHVEAEIVKGQYHEYDTFLAKEAVEALRNYLRLRELGTRDVPPEKIVNDSPLIRNEWLAAKFIREELIPPRITTDRLRDIVHGLYRKVGLIRRGAGGRYELRAHSLRKFFKTQLEAKGVKTIYVEYMMGHVRSPYDKTVEMKGVEFLRKIYAAADLRIKPRPTPDEQFFALIEEFIRGKGFDVNRELLKRAITKPHRTIVTSVEMEKERRRLLRETFIKLLREEIL